MAIEADKQAVMGAIDALGKKVFRSGKFHWYSKDTPDCSVNPDGTIHCWTEHVIDKDGRNPHHGDLIAFIMADSNWKIGFREAHNQAYALLNQTPPPLDKYEDDGYIAKGDRPKKEGPIAEKYIKGFEEERFKHFNTKFKPLLNRLLPSLTFEQQKHIAIKYKIGYSEMADRIIVPTRNEYGEAVNLIKYNPTKANKYSFTEGRERILFNLADLEEYRKDLNGWVILTEGEKNALNAVGHGFRAVSPGAAGNRIAEKYVPYFKGMKILIVGDYDAAGEMFKKNMSAQMEGVAETVKILDWEVLSLLLDFELKKGFDLTDFFCIIGPDPLMGMTA